MMKYALLLFATFAFAGEPHPGLKDPSKATEKAPDTFRVAFKTTKGDFTVKIHRDWSPLGVDRFYNLVKIGFFQDLPFYRVIDGFIAQFGFHGDPEVNDAWSDATIKDEPVKQSNLPGTLTFANRGPNTRTTQLFINTRNNSNLDPMGFIPFGVLEGEGLAVVKSLYSGYGERGPNQSLMKTKGAEHMKEFPNLDYIKSVRIID